MTDNASRQVRAFIEAIPNLLQATIREKFTDRPITVTHSQAEVAARIAAVFGDSMRARGCVVVELPSVETDEHGQRSVRIPLTSQPWADGEIRIDHAGRIAVHSIPAKLFPQDAAAVAGALLALSGPISRCNTPRGMPRTRRR